LLQTFSGVRVMRKIVVEVPKSKCVPKCTLCINLIKKYWCPMRGFFKYEERHNMPVKACRELEISGGE
jgi:hypothetical protein